MFSIDFRMHDSSLISFCTFSTDFRTYGLSPISFCIELRNVKFVTAIRHNSVSSFSFPPHFSFLRSIKISVQSMFPFRDWLSLE